MATLEDTLQTLVEELGAARLARHRRAPHGVERAERLFDALITGTDDPLLKERGRRLSSGLLRMPPPEPTPPLAARPPEATSPSPNSEAPDVAETAARPAALVEVDVALDQHEPPADSALLAPEPAAQSDEPPSDSALLEPEARSQRALEDDFAEFDEASLSTGLSELDEPPVIDLDEDDAIEIEAIVDEGFDLEASENAPPPLFDDSDDPEDVDQELRAFFDDDGDNTLAVDPLPEDSDEDTLARDQDVRSSVKKLFGK